MRKEDCFRLGYVSKTYSFRGEVIVFFDVPDPQKYEKLESVFVDLNNKLVPFFIDHIRFDRKNDFARIKFEDVNDESGARMLVKSEVYIPDPGGKHRAEQDADPDQLVGYAVRDTELGPLGEVASFISSQTNPLLDVSGKKGNIFIPFNEAFVLGIDHENRIIDVEIPEGLIGLNN